MRPTTSLSDAVEMPSVIRCDVVVLSWNQLETTQRCLASLVRGTDVPVRLIIVDNGSEPKVRQALQQVRPREAVREVVVIQNDTNEGFARGMNRGLRASRAPYVALLNNDILVTSGWLSRMLEVAEAHPEIGLLDPDSTFGQRPPPLEALEAHARGLESQRGLYVEAGMCVGFCTVIKRQVINRIGLLTEDVDRAFFEDEDYCMRAQQVGFQCVVVRSAYVYHLEHHTVRHLADRQRLFRKNQRWCEGRWGKRLRIGYPKFTPVIPGSQELRVWLERLRAIARQRAFVHVYCPTPIGMDRDALFRSVGLVPHTDVRWQVIPRRLAPWAAAGAILKRQKKRFDAIVAPDVRWGSLMTGLRWVHRADVIPETHEEQLIALWKPKSRSPSSS